MVQLNEPDVGRALLFLLLEKASEQGFITYEDILDYTAQHGGVDVQPERLMAMLRRRGVEVIDDSTPAAEAQIPEKEIQFDLLVVRDFPGTSTEDTVEIYLKEMSLVPLLSVEEEVFLAKRIAQGRSAKQMLANLNGRKNTQSKSELREAIEEGIKARNHIIQANTRLVVSIAKRYIGRGVPFLDLIQEGNLGLMKAVEKFDYRRGFRFSTYATWWIRQTITRSLADQGRTIRLPVHMSDRIRRMYRLARELEQSLRRPPTIEELSEGMNVPLRKVQWMLQVSWAPLSLESPVGEEDDAELGMFVEDRTTPTPVQVVSHTMLREHVEEVLSTLTPREARILRLRFGLDEGQSYTLEEVGAKFGLTRERIRQIEGQALRRLRHPGCTRRLKDYL